MLESVFIRKCDNLLADLDTAFKLLKPKSDEKIEFSVYQKVLTLLRASKQQTAELKEKLKEEFNENKIAKFKIQTIENEIFEFTKFCANQGESFFKAMDHIIIGNIHCLRGAQLLDFMAGPIGAEYMKETDYWASFTREAAEEYEKNHGEVNSGKIKGILKGFETFHQQYKDFYQWGLDIDGFLKKLEEGVLKADTEETKNWPENKKKLEESFEEFMIIVPTVKRKPDSKGYDGNKILYTFPKDKKTVAQKKFDELIKRNDMEYSMLML